MAAWEMVPLAAGSAAFIFGNELRRVPLLRLLQRRFDTLHKRFETRAEERGADPL
jgi:hypothetical protein